MRPRERFLLAALLATAIAAIAFGMSEGGADAGRATSPRPAVSPIVTTAEAATRALRYGSVPPAPARPAAPSNDALVASIGSR